MINFRSYRPDEAINQVSLGLDYAADYAGWMVARDLLSEAEADEAAKGAAVPAAGEGQYPLVRNWAEYAIAQHTTLLMRGLVHQAEATLASYPVEVKTYAEGRDWCPIPGDLDTFSEVEASDEPIAQ